MKDKILRILHRNRGFCVLPVTFSDLGEVTQLIEWVQEGGYQIRVLQVKSDEEWLDFALRMREPPDRVNPVTVVIFDGDPSPGALEWGLFRLNVSLNHIAAQAKHPIFFCGDARMLSWISGAPDFTSIMEVPMEFIEGTPGVPSN